jgi:hypothetical protein
MSNQNVSFRDLINEIYRLNELFIINESRQFSYLLEDESFKQGFYNQYKEAFQELLIAAIQQAKFQSEIAEVIDFIRQSYRFMEDKGGLRDLFERMATSAFSKAGEIADAEIKPKSILESAVFRALNFGFVETFAAGAYRLVTRPAIEAKSSGFPPETKTRASYGQRVLPAGSAGHNARSMKALSKREAVAASVSAKPETIPESSGFRALRFGFVETLVAGFWRLVKWLKPDNVQTIRPEGETKSSARMISAKSTVPETKYPVKNTESVKTEVVNSQSNNVDVRLSEERNSVLLGKKVDAAIIVEKPVVKKSDHSNAPELSEIIEAFPTYVERLKIYQDLWKSRAQKNTAVHQSSASFEIK